MLGELLEYAIATGDLDGARAMVSMGATIPPDRALMCCVAADTPGMARMLACEGVIDAAAVDCDKDCDGRVMETEHVAADLLSVGMKLTPRTRTEAALFRALSDSRCSTAAAAIMMHAAVSSPVVYGEMLDVAGECPAGKVMLASVVDIASRCITSSASRHVNA